MLVGCNQLIHVDTSGSSQGIITNKFAEATTDYRSFIRDQSELDLNLEHCVLQDFDTLPERLLLISEAGVLYWLSFKVEGRLVRTFEIVKIDDASYDGKRISAPATSCSLGRTVFVGSRDGDSVMIELSGEFGAGRPLAKRIEQEDDDIDYSDEEENGEAKKSPGAVDDDSIVEDDEPAVKGEIKLTITDALISLGSMSDFTLAPLSTQKFSSGLGNPNYNEISVVASSGNEKLGSISTVSPTVAPEVLSTLKFSNIDRVWTLCSHSERVTAKGVTLRKSYNYLITTNVSSSKSDLFSVNNNFQNVSTKTGFQKDEVILNIGFINNKRNIVHITEGFIYLYDLNFRLLMLLTVKDLEIEPEARQVEEIGPDGETVMVEKKVLPEIVYGFLYQDVLMVTASNGVLRILEFDPAVVDKLKKDKKSNKRCFEFVAIPAVLKDEVIITGTVSNTSLFGSVDNVAGIVKTLLKTKLEVVHNDSLDGQRQGILFLVVTVDNRVAVFQKNHGQKVFQLNYIDKLSEHLSLNFFNNNHDEDPDPFIKQIMLVDLGDAVASKQYLSVLTIGGETYFYELYYDKINQIAKFKKDENTLVTGAPENAFPWGTRIERRFIYVDDFENGLKLMFVTGIIPYVVIKERHSNPRVFKFTKLPALTFASFKSQGDNAFVFVDDNMNARICRIPYDDTTCYSNLLPISKHVLGVSIKSITYHQSSNMFILSTFKDIPYVCLDEEGNIVSGTEEDKPKANAYKGSLKLVSPKTWSVIDEFEFEDNQVALSTKAVYLTTSPASDSYMDMFNQLQHVAKRKKEVVVVGTGKLRMEDLASYGSFYLFEIIEVIPEIGKPEFNHKFKELFKEDTRGAVTSMTEISGRFLTSQGQKVIVRDFQEDNSVVPVAFLDTPIYVSDAKSYGNLLLLGDMMKSIWLVGFDAEPYRMILLSKDVAPVDVTAADFISHNGDIFFLVGDNDENLHLLQFDPEDPASSSGQRLIRKATFHINTATTTMRLVPKKASSPAETFIIGANVDGSMYSVTPISEDSYRRLYVLQQQIIDKEQHYLGLNPRLNRVSPTYETINKNLTFNLSQQIRLIIDYEVLRIFVRLSDDRKKQLALKAGRLAYGEIWKDLIEHSLNSLE